MRDNSDYITVALAAKNSLDNIGTFILTFVTGANSEAYYESLYRDPLPETDWVLSNDLPNRIEAALSMNPSVHDGAMIFGRNDELLPYKLQAWSCRLLPPIAPIASKNANKGVAWNSCYSMSLVEGVDGVALVSGKKLYHFIRGKHEVLHPDGEPK